VAIHTLLEKGGGRRWGRSTKTKDNDVDPDNEETEIEWEDVNYTTGYH
jgi:hypothetical protein